MKKLLTLVLALVMVFAVAAPAMALTDDALGTVADAVTDYYELSVAMYTGNIASLPVAGSVVTIPTLQVANREYVPNETIYFGVKLLQKAAVPSNFNMKAPNALRITSTYNATYSTKLQYVIDKDMKSKGNPHNEAAFATKLGDSEQSNGTWVALSTDFRAKFLRPERAAGVNPGTKLQDKGDAMYIFGSFINGKKAFDIKVELAPLFDLAHMDAKHGYSTWHETTTDGIWVAQATAVKAAFPYRVTDGTWTIGFHTDAVNRVDRMRIVREGYNYASPFDNSTTSASSLEYDEVWDTASTGYIIDWNIANVKATAGEKSAVETMFKALGFDIAKLYTGAVEERHFVNKVAGARLTTTEAEGHGAYHAAAVVTIPDVEVLTPPKTGDASTMAGFVMIAAAIVAVLGLAYNKVRA